MARVVTTTVVAEAGSQGKAAKDGRSEAAPSVTTSSTARISTTENKTGSLPNPIPASCYALAARAALDGSSTQHPHSRATR